mgnify:CR=1 FL=1
MGDMTPNFSRIEFMCQCGCGSDNISEGLVERLQLMRNSVGPMAVTSGIRCQAHNAAVGGVDISAHVPADLGDSEGEVGHAVDISVVSSSRRFKLYDAAREAGLRRIGTGRNFLHLDTDNRKPDEVLFDYYSSDHVA